MGNFLKGVTSGLRERPIRVVLYGTKGIGKTSWAKDAPRPIFLEEHGGTDELDVERLPQVDTYPEALTALDELANDEHPYQTFVLDTADWLEPLIWKYVCERGMLVRGAREPVENIEVFPYGKGFLAALDEWRVIISKLETLESKRNMNVIVLAHAHTKTLDPPDTEKYDQWQMKLNQKASALLGEWSKALLFATYETYVKKEKGERKGKAYGEGARIVHSHPRPAWEAKSRYPIPAVIPLSWSDFEHHARRRFQEKPQDYLSQIEQLLTEADKLTQTQGRAALGRCGKDSDKLAKLLEWLRGKVLTAA